MWWREKYRANLVNNVTKFLCNQEMREGEQDVCVAHGGMKSFGKEFFCAVVYDPWFINNLCKLNHKLSVSYKENFMFINIKFSRFVIVTNFWIIVIISY